MKSRRDFIFESTLLAATAAATPRLAAAAAIQAHRIAAGELEFETFAGLLNQWFRASLPGAREVMVELIAANRLRAAHGEQFVLIFRGPQDHLLKQDTYWFEQQKLGRFPMFIVPTASSVPGVASYVAVFNRLEKHPSPRAGDGLQAP